MAGKYYDDLAEGDRFEHACGRTLTQADNLLFCGMTLNTQPLHINRDFAEGTQFGRPLINGILTMGLVVGITVPELTEGTIVANLSYDRVIHPHPVFEGDTIYAETEVLERRLSRSQPDRGIVRLLHRGYNQHRELVVEIERTVMFLCRPSSL